LHGYYEIKKAAMSSAASLPMSFLEILNLLSDVVFCNPLAILIAPSFPRLFSLMRRICSLVLWDKIAAILSAVSLPILLFEITNSLRDEIFCKPLVI